MYPTFKAFGNKLVTRAPKGGIASHPVNGRAYKGGCFCPLLPISGGSDETTPAAPGSIATPAATALPRAEFTVRFKGTPPFRLVCLVEAEENAGELSYGSLYRTYDGRGGLITESYRTGRDYDTIAQAAADFDAFVARSLKHNNYDSVTRIG